MLDEVLSEGSTPRMLHFLFGFPPFFFCLNLMFIEQPEFMVCLRSDSCYIANKKPLEIYAGRFSSHYEKAFSERKISCKIFLEAEWH